MNKLTTREKRLGIKLLLSEVKTTSLRIAEVTGKKHFHIMRDIRQVVDNLNKSGNPKMDSEIKYSLTEYIDSRGKLYPMFELNEDATLHLITKYDDVIRAGVITELKRLRVEMSNANKVLQAFNTQRLSVVDSNKDMTKKLMESYIRTTGDKPHFTKYINENKDLFQLAFGLTPSQYKKAYSLEKKDTPRNNLSKDELALLVDLEKANAMLIAMEVSRPQRFNMLQKTKVDYIRDLEASKSLTDKQHLVVY